MTTIKEILSEVTCKKCGNNNPKSFELIFEISEGKTSKYLLCNECNTLFDFHDRTKEFLLEPCINTGG